MFFSFNTYVDSSWTTCQLALSISSIAHSPIRYSPAIGTCPHTEQQPLHTVHFLLWKPIQVNIFSTHTFCFSSVCVCTRNITRRAACVQFQRPLSEIPYTLDFRFRSCGEQTFWCVRRCQGAAHALITAQHSQRELVLAGKQITNLDAFKHLVTEEIQDSVKLQRTGWTMLLLTHHRACLQRWFLVYFSDKHQNFSQTQFAV